MRELLLNILVFELKKIYMLIKYNTSHLKSAKKKIRFFRLKIKKKNYYDLLHNLTKVNFVETKQS